MRVARKRGDAKYVTAISNGVSASEHPAASMKELFEDIKYVLKDLPAGESMKLTITKTVR